MFYYQVFLYYIANFFPNVHIFIKNFSFFYHKYIHSVSSKSILYALTFGKNMHERLIFFIFVTNEIYKVLLTERKLFTY